MIHHTSNALYSTTALEGKYSCVSYSNHILLYIQSDFVKQKPYLASLKANLISAGSRRFILLCKREWRHL